MREIREYNMNGTIILGVDNGYGNVKTAHRVFPTGIVKCDSEPVLSKEYIEYDGAYYIIGEGHKGFVADKQEDDDTYIMTLAAIAKELEAHPLTIYITPLKEGANVNVESAMAGRMEEVSSAVGEIDRVELVPVYEMQVL